MGIPVHLVDDLILRRVLVEGRVATNQIAEAVCVPIPLVEERVRGLRERRLLESDGMEGRNFVIQLTELGRSYTDARSTQCRYAGPAPVAIDEYAAVVRAQRPSLVLDRTRLEKAMSDLVLSERLIDQIGPAIQADGAIFFHGPPGTGKTSIAQRVIRAYEDVVLIPWTIFIEGQIITVFDPSIHHPIDIQPPGMDPRWVACKRPAVVTGGEMHAGMLDLDFDTTSGVFVAPLQLRSNNGVLVVDDFGRQAMSPDALLNRWIVPLDRRIDYLTLVGRKIEVPFEVKVVFSTNVRPEELGDEAFFRRIHNKIFVGAVSEKEFDWILDRAARAAGFEVTVEGAARIREQSKERGDGELRAYLPNVVCAQADAICRFDGLARILRGELVDRALDLYFSETW